MLALEPRQRGADFAVFYPDFDHVLFLHRGGCIPSSRSYREVLRTSDGGRPALLNSVLSASMRRFVSTSKTASLRIGLWRHHTAIDFFDQSLEPARPRNDNVQTDRTRNGNRSDIQHQQDQQAQKSLDPDHPGFRTKLFLSRRAVRRPAVRIPIKISHNSVKPVRPSSHDEQANQASQRQRSETDDRQRRENQKTFDARNVHCDWAEPWLPMIFASMASSEIVLGAGARRNFISDSHRKRSRRRSQSGGRYRPPARSSRNREVDLFRSRYATVLITERSNLVYSFAPPKGIDTSVRHRKAILHRHWIRPRNIPFPCA